MKVSCLLLCLASLFLPPVLLAAGPSHKETARETLRKEAWSRMRAGNYAEALTAFQKLALDPAEDQVQVGPDLENAVSCLQILNRLKEADALRETVVQVHAENWRALQAVARSLYQGDHSGSIVAGQFERGPHRGQGKVANACERDRVRALQLMGKAMEKLESECGKTGASAARPSASEVGYFFDAFAQQWMGGSGFGESWRLQYLTDLGTLPDYEEGYGYLRGAQMRGAPVDEKGYPVFHALPRSYAGAKTDGERWRWCLMQTMERDPSRADGVKFQFAGFLNQQFGVQTMADGGWGWRPPAQDDEKAESGTYALHTLADDETIARLASGIKRFRLPEEYDFIRIYRELGAARSGHAESALSALAEIHANRRHYEQAAECWRLNIKNHGAGHEQWKTTRLDQIVKNWGRFEPVMTQPAGEGATVEYRFRNGQNVSFDAREIKVDKLLGDIKDYLKSNPRELDWDRMNLGNVGYMLVEKNQSQYVGAEVAHWELSLEPKPRHFDRLITVKTPLKKAGAYLLTATLAGGNVSKIIIWIDDTVIARKNLDQGAYFYVADAVDGAPLPKMNVEFFGYRQEGVTWEKAIGRHYNVLTTAFAEYTDAQGQVMPAQKDFQSGYQWLITATSPEGRLAFLGFSHTWYGRYYDQEYNERKVFGITDRPVYRPDQTVKFKFWVREAKYDQDETSSFARQEFAVVIANPQGEKVFEKAYRTDDFAGLNGEFVLPKDAQLGQYQAYLPNGWGSVTFRVEEYKKPEFEVNIEAPTEPVMLGEAITATIKARYYFGAPVKNAKVKVKVMRSDTSANWYPRMPWDWFYGSGYWWFAYDYAWYPRWSEWGCRCPRWWWWPAVQTPPEIVAESEVPIGEDGTLKVPIDTRPAAELHGDTDHKYTITAEVTDASRRTIVGEGTVLVARKP
ncbi:MAG: MG2 domain-containing protein, partial [bacterium]